MASPDAWRTIAALLTVLWALWAAGVLLRVNRIVPEAYMDEIFHVPMARLYCDGHWDVWDDKVTTPPGLYVLAAVANFFVPGACSVVGLRILNAVIGLSTVPVIAALLHVLRTPYSLRDPRHWVEALAISLFPMAHHFVFFAYTDTASTFLVLFGLLWALRGHPAFSALIFLVSLTFRQTNAVWMAFAAALYVLQRRPLTAYVQLSTANATVHGLVDECRRLVRASLQNLPQLLVEVWPFAVPAALFAAFLVWNDGIVLGDRAAHVSAFHLPQLLYFAVIAVAFSAPAFLSLAQLRQMVAAAKRQLSTWRGVAVAALAVATLVVAIRYFTIGHLYLLSDNRHLSSAAWRHLFSRHWAQRYLYVPAYLAALWLLRQHLGRRPALWTLAYAVAVALVLVPAPLIEARYFVLPYLIFRVLAAPPPSIPRVAAEAVLYAAINAGVLYLFLYRPFVWPSEPLRWQRYMW